MAAIAAEVSSVGDADAQATHDCGVARQADLMHAVQKYFDLMYDCDTSRFADVFCPSVLLHGFRDGQLMSWPAAVYRDILDKRQSPKSLRSPREEEVLMVDFVSDEMALTKVRVRISAMMFIDYLTWHYVDGRWLITSKGFFVESRAHQNLQQ